MVEHGTEQTFSQSSVSLEEPILDLTNDPADEMPDDFDFASMIDESFNTYARGEIITGKVIKVTSDEVVIDIGSKSEGTIALSEFQYGKDLNVFVGMDVEVMVLRGEGGDGRPVLSHLKARELKVRDRLRAAFTAGEYVDCVIKSVVKGGFEADVDGIRGFIPFSQMALGVKSQEDRESLVGQTVEIKILEMQGGNRDLVLSQRQVMDERREKLRKSTLENLQEGELARGVVKNITDFGAFVDLGGVDGLLHINDISWNRVNKPQEVVNIGDQINVKVLNIDGERISVGLKQTTRDPWLSVHEKFPPSAVLTGKVTNLEKYGAFIELEEGIEGLIHISEMSWIKRIKHPSELLKTGEKVDVKVLSIDDERKRISLSLRQTEVDPWTLAKTNYPQGTVLEGEVTGMTDFGAFISLPEGIDGMVHVSDMSWEKKIANPSQVLKKGDRVRVKVLEIVPEEKRISLGIKQLEADPWESAASRYRTGTNLEGKITRITDFGAFVELERGIEGLAHSSTLVLEKGKTPRDVVKVGDVLQFKVIKFDLSARKISLSHKDFVKEQEKVELAKYMAQDDAGGATLGELLGAQMKKLMDKSDTVSSDEADFFTRNTNSES